MSYVSVMFADLNIVQCLKRRTKAKDRRRAERGVGVEGVGERVPLRGYNFNYSEYVHKQKLLYYINTDLISRVLDLVMNREFNFKN